MNHSRTLTFAIFFSFSYGLAHADKIDGRLSAARKVFFASQAEFRNSMLEWFDSREKRARKKGDRAAVVALLAEREEFTSEDILDNVTEFYFTLWDRETGEYIRQYPHKTIRYDPTAWSDAVSID